MDCRCQVDDGRNVTWRLILTAYPIAGMYPWLFFRYARTELLYRHLLTAATPGFCCQRVSKYYMRHFLLTLGAAKSPDSTWQSHRSTNRCCAAVHWYQQVDCQAVRLLCVWDMSVRISSAAQSLHHNLVHEAMLYGVVKELLSCAERWRTRPFICHII